MLTFVLVVYVASASASFQTMGPFDTKGACDSMKSQMAETFPDIKTGCLSMNTQALQSISAAKYDPPKPTKVAEATVAPLAAPVPLPKIRPRVKLMKSCKAHTQAKATVE